LWVLEKIRWVSGGFRGNFLVSVFFFSSDASLFRGVFNVFCGLRCVLVGFMLVVMVKKVKNTTKKKCIRRKKKNTETKKFPRKPPETHLIFSKTHNPHPFTFTTNENSAKLNGHHKPRQKEPQKEQDHHQTWKKFPKNHRSTPKAP